MLAVEPYSMPSTGSTTMPVTDAPMSPIKADRAGRRVDIYNPLPGILCLTSE